jgi:hypothetical protein
MPFDATTKELVAADPRGWADLLLGRKVAGARRLDVDLATIMAEADSVIEVQESDPCLVHVAFPSGDDPSLPRRLQRDNVPVNDRHELPFHGIALRPCKAADGRALGGDFRQHLPDGSHQRVPRRRVEALGIPRRGGPEDGPLCTPACPDRENSSGRGSRRDRRLGAIGERLLDIAS